MTEHKLTIADLDAALQADYFGSGPYWGYLDDTGQQHL
jgi:hypothetical protein